LIDSIKKQRTGLRFAIVVYTSFRIRESSVKGYLVLVLSVISLNRLIAEIDRWENDQNEDSHSTSSTNGDSMKI
jgi:chemotaxis protein CheC